MTRRRLPDDVPVSHQAKWSRANKAKGLCSDCKKPSEPGHTLCREHLDKRKAKWHENKDKWKVPPKSAAEPKRAAVLPEDEDGEA